MEHTQELNLEVTPGMPEGHEVVFEGEADESPDWEAGDVVIRLRSKKDKGGWRRKETSLYWRETIGIDEVRDTIRLEASFKLIIRYTTFRHFWALRET
jgi:DnaJ-related protein SCJ1